ncbi:hypothetical protein [Wolbachia endosymbiont (group E) of Neria commutata]|uniref:hypothetical protein n=1 Tax=Wolbachia endosymbiont (group E) of Neria commutata TaxID=3066149 RepID=UPI003132CFD7
MSEAEIDIIKKTAIKGIVEVRTRLMIALDNLDLEKYVSEGKVEMLEKYLDMVGRYFKITADILHEREALDDKDKSECEDLVAKKLKRIKKILSENAQSQNGPKTNGDDESEAQNESEQPQQRAQSADNIPNQKIKNESNPQTDPHEPQNTYDNGMYCAVGVAALGFTLIGVILCATVNPIAGGIIIAATTVSLVGVVAMKTYEKKKEKPEMDTWTAFKEVFTFKCMSDNDVVNPSLGTSRGA